MAPPRQPRAPTEDLLHPPTSVTNPRHIHAREKDVLHKTIGSTGISKTKKITNPSRTPTTNSAATQSSNNDLRRPTNPPQNPMPRPTWKTGPGSSEQRMKWSSMTNTAINKWRTYLALPLSAPFSSESARISLENRDGIGSHSASMSGSPSRHPRPRSDVEHAIAEAFESRPVDEDEVIAGFLARGEEERRIANASRPVLVTTTTTSSFAAQDDNLFGRGGRVLKPVRCRSDMLS